MDDRQTRIAEDLAGLLRGEVRCDALTRAEYATDASLYQIQPLGVAFPRDRDDVLTLARFAAEFRVPLIARGAGTGVAGESLGQGLVVDFSRHMRRIEVLDEHTVRVQPGMVHERLNHVLRDYGRYFPPDPSGTSVTTIGSMLALDAAGAHSVRVGSTRDHVQSLEVVLAGGACFEAGNEPLDLLKTPPQNSGDDATAVKRSLLNNLAPLLAVNERLIQEKQSSRLIRNRAGYCLRGVLSKSHLNLARMLIGSEGTLALFTAATLHTSPLPTYRGALLLLFQDVETAVRAAQLITPQQPSACDLLDRRLLSLGREADPRFERLIPVTAEAALIVEQTGFSTRQVRDRLRMIVAQLEELDSAVQVAFEAESFEDVEFVWSLPHKVVPMLNRLRGPTRPLPFVEDVAVPPDAVHEFLVKAQRVFQRHEVTSSLYAHVAAGQLHLRPFLPTPVPNDVEFLEAIARDLYQVVFSVGGTISGEHGLGLARTAFLRSQYGPLYKVLQQIKQIFDPHNLLNPGKIISDDPHVTVKNLRPAPIELPPIYDLQLKWTPAELQQATLACNGCGTCRTQEPGARMCPFFRADPSEEASPRAKANVLRNIAAGLVSPQELASPEMRRIARLCCNCKQCQLECPTNVDVPHFVIEAKAAYVAANGLSRADWLLSRLHAVGRFGSRVAPVLNRALNTPSARWLLEKLGGIARQRKLPPFAREPFLRSAKSIWTEPPQITRDHRPVVYFVDHYANYHDPELARAFVAILEHHGIPVHVPPRQSRSGMAMVSVGDLETARGLAEHNVRLLAEFAREGCPIICTEPAAALALRHEYPMLLDHPDVPLVAAQVIEAGAFLEQLHQARTLKTNFRPLAIDAGYHTPCHLRALGRGTPLRNLCNLIPELRVHTIEKGCSGMAGTFGLARENYRDSLRIGWGLISRMRSGDLTIGLTECSSCKLQMEQGTSIPTLHPLKLLALSYGLMPELQDRLRPSTNRLLVT